MEKLRDLVLPPPLALTLLKNRILNAFWHYENEGDMKMKCFAGGERR